MARIHTWKKVVCALVILFGAFNVVFGIESAEIRQDVEDIVDSEDGLKRSYKITDMTSFMCNRISWCICNSYLNDLNVFDFLLF